MGEVAGGGYSAKQFLGVMRPVAQVSETRGRASLQCPTVTKSKSQQPIRIRIRSQMVNQKPSTYCSRISTDIPLYETPEASFDQYLEDKPRVFRAIFPDKKRSQQLNEEEWRVRMLPLQFLFLTVLPVVDMRLRCRTNEEEYPPGIPPNISKVLELDIVGSELYNSRKNQFLSILFLHIYVTRTRVKKNQTRIRWKLEGLDNVVKPTHFSLGVKGALYPDRRGVRSRLKGELEMKISVILPPVLDLVPEGVRQSVSESVLKTLVENMRQKVNGSLLADYSEFRRERQMNPV